jgi:class 3 adenylate cyclase
MPSNAGAIIRAKSQRGVTRVPDDLDNPSAHSLERKLATIVSADVAEFSRLMGEDEEQTLRTFRGHKQVFESLVTMHRGRIFNTAGDAILAEFGSAVEAVRCATDIQAALRTRNDQLQPSRQVRFRIGINLGDVMVQGQDLLGDGVNVAARLQTAAEPGGICISGSVHDQIRNKLSLSFQSLGERNFKNIQQPVRTFSITEAEGHGALPSPKPRRTGSSWARWIAAGLLLVVAAVGYWAYILNERSKAQHAPAIATTTQPEVTTREIPKPIGEKPATEQPQPAPTPARPVAAKVSPAAKNLEPQPASVPPVGKTAEAPQLAPPSDPTKRNTATAAATPAPSAGTRDGTYSGPICFGKTLIEPVRCFRAQGTITGSKITGQWPVGKDTGVTMFLAGDVSKSGDVKIEMHSEKADGSRLVTIDLTGTFHDQLLDATGTFRRGRSATLNWHRSSPTAP